VTEGKGRRWHWLPAVALGAYALRSGEARASVWWAVILGMGLIAWYGLPSSGPPRKWAAYALNWSAPAVVLVGCAQQAVSKDYWGVAFFSILFGFTLVNAALLEPSPRRTMLFRTMTVLLVAVSAAAIWKTVRP